MNASPLSREIAGRIPELDGLRGIAIGMVVLFHYFQLTGITRPGSLLAYLQAAARLTWSGVDLFFVLSGFLIGGILIDASAATNYFQVFYTRRFFRIVPVYTAVLLVCPILVAAAQRIHNDGFIWLNANALPWYCYWTFTQNFWMAHAGNLGSSTLAVTWSLAVEEQFYLTLPLVVRLFTGNRLITCVLIGICTAPVLRITLGLIWHHSWVARFVLMPCRADALLLGVLAAILLRDARWRERIGRSDRPFAILFPFFLVGLAALTIWSASVGSPAVQSIGYTWLAFFYVSVLIYALTRPRSVLSRALRVQWLGWLGGIAYGCYLFHTAIDGMFFALIWHHDPVVTDASTLLTTLAALILTIVLARTSWHYFERPLIKIGHRSIYRFNTPSLEQAVPSRRGVGCS
jgi:peptidoglycan/LPS O-acetylase OafA/YrhL